MSEDAPTHVALTREMIDSIETRTDISDDLRDTLLVASDAAMEAGLPHLQGLLKSISECGGDPTEAAVAAFTMQLLPRRRTRASTATDTVRTMSNRNQNNIRAEATADQMQAAIRDGEIPTGENLDAAVARTIRVEDLPEGVRGAADDLLELWADQNDVDRPPAPK